MRLEIYAGKQFVADFTVVSSDGVTGEQLVPGDTCTFTASTSGINPTCVLANIPMVITDEANGIFTLSLTPTQTAVFSQEPGFQEDNYSPLSNYVGFLDFDLQSGDRQAHCDLYIKEIGTC